MLRAPGSVCHRWRSGRACDVPRPEPWQPARASSSACLAQRSEHRARTAITICSSNGFLVYCLYFLFQQLTASNVLFLLQSRKENRTGNQETKTIACVGSLPPRHLRLLPWERRANDLDGFALPRVYVAACQAATCP